MRITFVSDKLNLKTGGGSNYTLDHLASGLAERGHEVTVVTVAPGRSAFPPGLPYRVVESPLVAGWHPLWQNLRLASTLKGLERRVDVYQIETPSLLLAGSVYRSLGGRVPIVARLPNYSLFCTQAARIDSRCFRHCTLLDRLRHRAQHPAKKLLEAPLHVVESLARLRLVDKVDRFIALSPAVAEIYSLYGVDPAKMEIISPAVDCTRLARLMRKISPDVRAPGQPYRLLYAGRLIHHKGVDTLLRAVAGLDFPVALDVVGDGPAREALQRLAGELGVAASVRFQGWRSQAELVEYYLAAQLFVHPGRWPEPAGRTIVEAMALGLPLVVSDIGGPPWIAGEAALRFAPEDHLDLRRRIAEAYHDPALAAALAAAGRRRVRAFDGQHMIERFSAVYERLGQGHPAAPLSRGAAA